VATAAIESIARADGALRAPTLRSLRPVILPVALGVTVIVLWEFAIWATDYPRVVMPAPSLIAATFVDRFAMLAENGFYTAVEALGGFFIATVLGTALAVALTWSAIARDAVYPNIVAFQIVPKIAWAPIFVLWMGIEAEARLGFATFVSIFPIIISMTAGLGTTDPTILKLCRALTASKWQTLVYVRFPFALPFLFSGMKIGITLAMIGVIVGEFISSQRGLGYVILTASPRAETELMMAAVLMLCLIGLVLYGGVALGTRLIDRWFGR